MAALNAHLVVPLFLIQPQPHNNQLDKRGNQANMGEELHTKEL